MRINNQRNLTLGELIHQAAKAVDSGSTPLLENQYTALMKILCGLVTPKNIQPSLTHDVRVSLNPAHLTSGMVRVGQSVNELSSYTLARLLKSSPKSGTPVEWSTGHAYKPGGKKLESNAWLMFGHSIDADKLSLTGGLRYQNRTTSAAPQDGALSVTRVFPLQQPQEGAEISYHTLLEASADIYIYDGDPLTIWARATEKRTTPVQLKDGSLYDPAVINQNPQILLEALTTISNVQNDVRSLEHLIALALSQTIGTHKITPLVGDQLLWPSLVRANHEGKFTVDLATFPKTSFFTRGDFTHF